MELEDGGDYNEHEESTKQYFSDEYGEEDDYDDLPEGQDDFKSSDTRQHYDDSTQDGNKRSNVQGEKLNADLQESFEIDGFPNNRDIDENEEEKETNKWNPWSQGQ